MLDIIFNLGFSRGLIKLGYSGGATSTTPPASLNMPVQTPSSITAPASPNFFSTLPLKSNNRPVKNFKADLSTGIKSGGGIKNSVPQSAGGSSGSTL